MNTLRTHERFAPAIEQRYDFLKRSVTSLGAMAVEMANGELDIEIKPDGSQVTQVDTMLNRLFIEMTQREFPDDLVWGEEEVTSERNDLSAADKAWTWIVDPLDGTRKFIEAHQAGKLGQCTSTVLAAAFAPGETVPTISAVYNPFQHKKLFIGTRPNGVEQFMPVTGVVRPLVIGDGPKTLEEVERYEYSSWGRELRQLDITLPLARRVRTQTRMASVALGDSDLAVFPAPSHPHDVLPGAHSVHIAGGTVRSLGGEKYEEIDWRIDPLNGVIATATPQLADELGSVLVA